MPGVVKSDAKDPGNPSDQFTGASLLGSSIPVSRGAYHPPVAVTPMIPGQELIHRFRSGPERLPAPIRVLRWAFLLSPFVYLWLHLVDHLKFEWSTNPEYNYGWVVPVLCISLLLRNGRGGQEGNTQSSLEHRWRFSSKRLVLGLGICLAFGYLPTRLVEAATPEWRPILWALAIITLGLTLCGIYLATGRGRLAMAAFPIGFFLVAIPWPTAVEAPIIQGLTCFSTAVVVEMLGAMGMPALQHGNVIEVATGLVGVDAACSGIRSFQSSIMVSLFLGEFFKLRPLRRLALLGFGFLACVALNLVRTLVLIYGAGSKGVDAVSRYHDPVGVTILFACTALMLVFALWLRNCRPKPAERMAQRNGAVPSAGGLERMAPATVGELQGGGGPPQRASVAPSTLASLTIPLGVWICLVEVGVQAWYRARESRLAPAPAWTLILPTNKLAFVSLPISSVTTNLLRFDRGLQGQWRDEDGSSWLVYYFEWFPGRVAAYLAKRHTPEICLPAAGQGRVLGPELRRIRVARLDLAVRRYVFRTAAGPLHVFHCRWDAGATSGSYVERDSERFNLVRSVWTGRGKSGQSVFEVLIQGYSDLDQAQQALVRFLENSIKVQPTDAVQRGG